MTFRFGSGEGVSLRNADERNIFNMVSSASGRKPTFWKPSSGRHHPIQQTTRSRPPGRVRRVSPCRYTPARVHLSVAQNTLKNAAPRRSAWLDGSAVGSKQRFHIVQIPRPKGEQLPKAAAWNPGLCDFAARTTRCTMGGECCVYQAPSMAGGVLPRSCEARLVLGPWVDDQFLKNPRPGRRGWLQGRREAPS